MEKTIKFLIFVLLLLLLGIYVISMLVYPFTQGDWQHAQEVWDRWQSLNVGVIALIASATALWASHYYTNRQYEQYEKQRARDFVAARAFLPDALSSLCGYLESCTRLLLEVYNLNQSARLHDQLPKENLHNTIPTFPPNYREVFSKCISLADPNMGDYLAKILRDLQIIHARISSLSNNLSKPNKAIITKQNIISYLHDVAEIRACIDMLFDSARGEELFEHRNLSRDDIVTAYSCLGVTQELDLLASYADGHLNRKNSDSKQPKKQ